MEAIIEFLGYIAALYLSYKIASFSLNFIIKNVLSSSLNVSKLGEWALVTGSTDGIGKAYAFALAKKGLNIILVSRTPYKLQNVAAEIETKHKVKTKIICVDFSSNPEDYITRLDKELTGLEIGVLVNNVGFNVDYPMMFLDMEEEIVNKIVTVNLTSLNEMTRLILPQMVERKKGAVINIGSLASEIPNPLYSVYAASKAYVAKFSQCLTQEYASKGVTVQCITPGYVVSNMSKIRRATFMAPTPEVFVASALKRLGIESFTTGYFSHDLMKGFLNLLPSMVSEKIVWDQLQVVRAKALKKKNKENKDQ